MPTLNSSVNHFVLTDFPDCPGSPIGPREPRKPFNTKESDNKGMIFASSKKRLLNSHLLWVLDLQGHQPGQIHPIKNNEKTPYSSSLKWLLMVN